MKTTNPQRTQARRILPILTATYPHAHCALHHRTPLQLLIATILSAQCTDVRVNLVTPGLFARYPDAAAFAAADQAELEVLIHSTGFYRNKAKNIIGCCKKLVALHGGEVPASMEDLVPLPGVGRKTANVILGNAFGVPGLVVDTHVSRLSQRLGLTEQTDAEKIERDLMALLPKEEWTMFSHRMIFHGRQICHARKPLCEECPLADLCPRVGVTA